MRNACQSLAPWILAAVVSVRSMRSMAPNSVTIANGRRICTMPSSTLNGVYRICTGPAVRPSRIRLLLTIPLSPSMTSQEKLRTIMSTQYGTSTISKIKPRSFGPAMVSA